MIQAIIVGQNVGIMLKNYRQYILKQAIHLAANHTKGNLSMNAGLLMIFISLVMQDKKRARVCRARFFKHISEPSRWFLASK